MADEVAEVTENGAVDATENGVVGTEEDGILTENEVLGTTENEVAPVPQNEVAPVPQNGVVATDDIGGTEDAVDVQDSSSRLDGGTRKSRLEWLRVDRKMLPSKMAYFMFYAAMGQYVWYINLFLTSIGLTSSEAGFITGMCFATSAIVGPLWGALSDYTGRRKLIFVVLCFFAAATFFSLPWIVFFLPESYKLVPAHGKNQTLNQTLFDYTELESDAHHYLIDQIPTNEIAPFTNRLFWIMLGCLLFVNVFLNPLAGLLDSVVMNVIKKNGDASSYGLQRLYGSLGGGITPLIGGILSDHYHPANMSKYTVIFYLYLPFMLIMIPIGIYLLKQSDWTREKKNKKVLTNGEIGVENPHFDQTGEDDIMKQKWKQMMGNGETADPNSLETSQSEGENGVVPLDKPENQTGSTKVAVENQSDEQESETNQPKAIEGQLSVTESEKGIMTPLFSEADLAKDIEDLLSITNIEGQFNLEKSTSEANIDTELVKDVEELLNATIEELEKNVDGPVDTKENIIENIEKENEENNTDENKGEHNEEKTEGKSEEKIDVQIEAKTEESVEVNVETNKDEEKEEQDKEVNENKDTPASNSNEDVSITDAKKPEAKEEDDAVITEEEQSKCSGANGTLDVKVEATSETAGESMNRDVESNSEPTVDKAKLLYDVIKQPDNIMFLISVLIGGFLLTITQYFITMTMTDEMKASGTSGGVAIITHCLSEVLMFPFARKLISVVGGPITSIQIGLLCYFIRHLVFSIIQNPWVVIAPQLLNSITFAFFIEAVMQYTQKIAPNEIYAIMFTTIYMLHFSLPGLLGNVFGGMIYEKYRGRILYRVSAGIALVWFIILTIYFNGVKAVKSVISKRNRASFRFSSRDSFIV